MAILSSTAGVITIAVATFTYLVLRGAQRSSRNLPLPPGPSGIWPIGNVLDIPRRYLWIKATEWKDSHGDLVCLRLLGKTVIILNTAETTAALLDGRGRIYSHRPILEMVGSLFGIDNSTPLLQIGSMWRLHRKLERGVLNGDALKRYYSTQEQNTAYLLDELLAHPNQIERCLRLCMSRMFLSISYGLPVKTGIHDSPYVRTAMDTMDHVTQGMVPGTHLVDILPLLRVFPQWLPGTSRHFGAKGRTLVDNMVGDPFRHVQKQMSAGTVTPSVASDLLHEADAQTNSDLRAEATHAAKWVSGTMYAAGGETTYGVLLWAVYALSRHQDMQRKLQAEIACVTTNSSLPLVRDIQQMPYLTAFVRETMRWRPVVPLGLPHCLFDNDVFQGYHLPRGATVLGNIWAISREGCGPGSLSLEEFIPERWLSPDECPRMDPFNYTFGFGPRQCPGKALAINNIYIILTSILSVYDIEAVVGEDGTALEPNFAAELLYYPRDLSVLFKPRSQQAIQLIQDTAALLWT